MPMNPKLRGALIGFGSTQTLNHLPAYRKLPDIELVAVADISEVRRDVVAQSLPDVRIYTSGDILLEQEDDLDFVDIAVAPGAHAKLCELALQKSLHVLCESTPTVDPKQWKSLMGLAQQRGRVLFPVHLLKNSIAMKRYKAAIDAIRPMGAVDVSLFQSGHSKGVEEWRPNWRRDLPFSGGGVMMDQGYQLGTLLLDWLDPLPTGLSAKMINLKGPKFDNEDVAAVTLQTATGLCTAQVSWAGGFRGLVSVCHGNNGTVSLFSDIERILLTTTLRSAPQPVQHESFAVSWGGYEAFLAVMSDFQKSISHHEWVNSESLLALKSLEMVSTAYQSAKEASRWVGLRLTTETPSPFA